MERWHSRRQDRADASSSSSRDLSHRARFARNGVYTKEHVAVQLTRPCNQQSARDDARSEDGAVRRWGSKKTYLAEQVHVGVRIAPAPKQPAYVTRLAMSVRPRTSQDGENSEAEHAGRKLPLCYSGKKKKYSVLDQWGDLGEWAGDGEAEPGAVEEQPRELGGREQDVGFHVAGHPRFVQLRAQFYEQGRHTAHM
jgi:hypothetical protein